MLKIKVRLKIAVVLASGVLLAGCKFTDGDDQLAGVNSPLVVTDGALPPPSVAPKILSFTASADAITKGESATLRWDVSGADKVSIEPYPGVVHGTYLKISPTETTKFSLVVSGSDSTDSASVDVAVLSGAGDWNVVELPPALSRPRSIDAAAVLPKYVKASGINCGGLIRTITLSGKEDAVVYMSGSKALRYPLRITGGRNVRVVGLQFELETQPGCGIGELPNYPIAKHPSSNIHPRVPGAMALRLEQSGTSFVEGLNIDVRGHEADCIVIRNPNALSGAQARKQRDVVIQNTNCSGVEGLGKTKIGEGIHGDLFQNQGGDIMRRLVFENVSQRTSQEGIVLHGGDSFSGAKNLIIRRFDYSWDPRYVGDDNYESFGLAFAGAPDKNNWVLENVRIDDFRDGGDYLRIRGQRYGNSSSGGVKPHPEIRSGLPPEGSFALQGRTGVNYLSPHGNVH